MSAPLCELLRPIPPNPLAHPEVIELDLNPVIVHDEGCTVVGMPE